MNKENISQSFDADTSELVRLINSWNLINNSSNTTFVQLAKKIINHLYNGQGEAKIKRVLQSELCVTLGLFSSDFNTENLSQQIMVWWNAKS